MRPGRLSPIFLAAVVLAMLPASAAAQSAIAGVVKDTTGAVLPGVAVEAASPALIEKMRTAVTDEAGQYKIVDLRPGTYAVTFSLAGFSTVKREGIVLTTNFTAPVNAELKVGALEETVTVTGASPIVDVQSATQQQQLSRETLDAIPTGRSVPAIGKVLPGIVPSAVDVGGSQGMQTLGIRVHGSEGNQILYQIDGMTLQSPIGDGTAAQYWNDGMFEEFTYQTSAIPAEVPVGGIRVLMTPKEGGNALKGYVLGQAAPWQNNNYTPELQARGLRTPDRILEIWDENSALGGPIKKDRLWFFFSQRNWGVNQLIAETKYHDRRLCTDVDWRTSNRERKFDCQGIDDNYINNGVLRLTWQVTKRNKLSAFYSKENKYRGHRELAPGVSPEATTPQIMNLSYGFQVKWVAPITNRLLWEAGVSQYFLNYDFEYQPPVKPTDRPHVDLVLQQTWGARPAGFFNRNDYKRYWSGSLSYVTGSHSVKTGFQFNTAIENSTYDRYLGHVVQEYRNGVPASVTVDNTPIQNRPRLDAEVGLFVQDSWTIRRLTLNPGIRFDYIKFSIDEQGGPAGRWVPARHFDSITNLPDFSDVSPRLSAVYDLFGNAKTAIQASIGEYVGNMGNSYADTYNPFFVDTDRRTWNDLNGDDIAQDNEIGPPAKSNFGIKAAQRPDPKLQRRRDWEYTASIQQEILPRISAKFAYIRRRFLDLPKSDNLLVGPEDYTPIRIPDPRGNGQQITVYNLNRAKFGLTDVLDTTSETNRRYWNGVELTANGRLRGGTTFGGLTMGGTSYNLCDVDDPNNTIANPTASNPPNGLRFCKRSEPWRPQVKFGGAYALPWRLQFSGTFVSFPGNNLGINYNVNRTIIPTLTQTQVVVPLDNPSDPDRTLNRLNQLDVRFAKTVQLGARRLVVQFDIFNATNISTVVQEVQTWGPALGNARSNVQGRLYQVGMQFYF